MTSMHDMRTPHALSGKVVRIQLAPPTDAPAGYDYSRAGLGRRFIVYDWFQNIKGLSWLQAGADSPTAVSYMSRVLMSSSLPADDDVLFGILLPRHPSEMPMVFLVHQIEIREVLHEDI